MALADILPIASSTLSTRSGLVSNWPFASSSTDIVGSNTGTDTAMSYNSATPPNSRFSGYATFNGTTSLVAVASATGLGSGANSFSMGGLWRSSDTTKTNTAMSYGNWTTANSRTLISLKNASPPNTNYFAGQSRDVQGTGNLSDGNWHWIVATYDGTTLKLYYDGSLDNSGNVALNITGTLLHFGQDNNSPAAEKLTGDLADWFNISDFLTPTEISNHWNGTDGLSSPTPSDRTQFLNFMIPSQGYNNA